MRLEEGKMSHKLPHNKKISVLFVLKNFSRSGGVEKITLNLIDELIKQDHKVGVFIMDGRGVSDNKFTSVNLFLGAKGGALGIVSHISKLANFISEANYDLVISAKEQANLLNFIVSSFNKKYMPVYTRHCAFDVSDQDLSIKQLKALYGLYSNGRGKVVAVSKDLGKYIEKEIPKLKNNVYICPNPVIHSALHKMALTNTEGFVHKKPYICAVGRLCEQKGFDVLLKIYKIALTENENIPDLIIVGEGADLADLKSLRKELDLDEKVLFHGYTENPYYIINNSVLFLLSSRHEGLPTVLIESLALKKSIVAFDCPTGPREILNNGEYGILVPENDLYKFAISINQLLVSPKLLTGDEVINYTPERSLASYLKLVD
jgi:glycosyltransferase involved in cell wall biosynthesis